MEVPVTVLEKLTSEFLGLCQFYGSCKAKQNLVVLLMFYCIILIPEEIRYNRAMLMEIREFIRSSQTKKSVEDLIPIPYFKTIDEVKDFCPSAEEYPKLVCLVYFSN